MSDPPSWFTLHILSYEMVHEFRRAGLFGKEIEALNVKFYQTYWFKTLVKRLIILQHLTICLFSAFIFCYFKYYKETVRFFYLSNKIDA